MLIWQMNAMDETPTPQAIVCEICPSAEATADNTVRHPPVLETTPTVLRSQQWMCSIAAQEHHCLQRSVASVACVTLAPRDFRISQADLQLGWSQTYGNEALVLWVDNSFSRPHGGASSVGALRISRSYQTHTASLVHCKLCLPQVHRIPLDLRICAELAKWHFTIAAT